MSVAVSQASIAGILQALAERAQTLATAESCTGGLLGHLVTETPGASAVYKGGVVAYANDVKERILGVSSDTLDREGAVSAATAQAMAAGAGYLLGATHVIAVTGIAGPGGGTTEKPVGLVYIAAGPLEAVAVRRYQFSGSRSEIKVQTAAAAFALLQENIVS